MRHIPNRSFAFRLSNISLSGILVILAVIFFGATANAATTSIPEDFRVEPEPGATVESIIKITIVNTEGDEIMNSGSKITINGIVYTTSPQVDWNRVTFVLDNPITEEGEYEVIIPQGRIQDEYWDDIDEFQFTIYIKSADTPDDDDPSTSEAIIPNGFTVSPAPGSEVESISELKLTYFDDFTDLSLVKKVIMIDGNEVAINGFGDWGELTITLINKITEAGVHRIVIPEGTFELDSMDDNELFSFTLTVTGSETPENPDEPGDDKPGEQLAGIPKGFTVTPANDATVNELTVITIIDENYGDMSVNNEAKLYIDGQSVDYTTEVKGEYDDTLVITLANAITAEGTHTIQLPAGFFNYMYYTPCKEFGWSVKIESSENDTPEPEVTIIPEGVTVSPEAGTTIEALSEISVAIDGWGDLYYMDFDYILINAERVSVKEGYGNPLKIQLTEEIVIDGTYWITIPANSIMNDYGKLFDKFIQFSVIVVSQSGINDVESVTENETEIYTLEGIRVNQMEAGRFYIIRRGNEITKTFAK